VTVAPPPVDAVTVAPPAPNVKAGQSVQLTATLKDANNNVLTDRTVAWSSSNPLRATVNAQGLVTTSLVNKGPVTITATSEGKSGSSVVTVQ